MNGYFLGNTLRSEQLSVEQVLQVLLKFTRAEKSQVRLIVCSTSARPQEHDCFISLQPPVLVIDPWGGSGSTVAAAIMLGCPVIYIDNDEVACKAAEWNVCRLAQTDPYSPNAGLLGTVWLEHYEVFTPLCLQMREIWKWKARQENSRRHWTLTPT